MHAALSALHAQWMNQWPDMDRGKKLDAFGHLVARYSEPHRAYHTLEHISDVLGVFSREADLAQNGDAVRLALWYHDVIYDYGPDAKDNELKSAEYARDELNKLGVSGSLVVQVYDLIMATRHTGEPLKTPDEILITDIDLASLGYTAREFDKGSAAIRFEYDWVPHNIYAARRISIMQGFLDRGVYTSQRFKDRYGRMAIANLEHEISALRRS